MAVSLPTRRVGFVPALVWVGMIAATPSVAQSPIWDALAGEESVSDEIALQLYTIGATMIRETPVPGMSLAVRAPDGAFWTAGFGLSDVENNVAATAGTVYRLASISKPMTAVVAMRLAAAGNLDLDRSVHSQFTSWPEKRWPVTPRQLLGHLGGVRHYKNRGEIRSNLHFMDVVEATATFRDDPLLHEPGVKFRYTTFGFNLVGALAQNVGDTPFHELLKKFVFDPAGMTHTRVDDAWAIIPRRAQGYRLQDGKLVNALQVDTSNKIPGGGLSGTAIDLVRFGAAMLDGRLVDDATRDAMWTRQKLSSGSEVDYGLGFSVQLVDDVEVVGHGGAQPRVRTLLRIWPETGVVVSVMCNLEGTDLGPVVGRVAKVVEDVGR